MSFDIGLRLPGKTFAEKVIAEKAERFKNTLNPLNYGVNFLDKATGGIIKNDLIIIGAKTGVGKTQLATLIAMNNAKEGKRVHYFALEAEPYEIERRIKYRMLASQYFASRILSETKISYPDWYRCKLEDVFADIEPQVNEMAGKIYSNLFTIYGNGSFKLKDFEKSFLAIQDQTDLVIIDHLHYFDFETTNENAEYKQIVKSIHDLALHIGKPVILVAHMRKSDRKEIALLPNIEDFHGTSDISKIATTAIIIGPAKNSENYDPMIWKTYMRIAKFRMDMSRTGYIAEANFDVKTQTYFSNFLLTRYAPFCDEFQELEFRNYPDWAK
jgi:replicative DNA helicase